MDTEGLEVYVPGAGILFENGICATLTQAGGTGGSVTVNNYRSVGVLNGNFNNSQFRIYLFN